MGCDLDTAAPTPQTRPPLTKQLPGLASQVPTAGRYRLKSPLSCYWFPSYPIPRAPSGDFVMDRSLGLKVHALSLLPGLEDLKLEEEELGPLLPTEVLP